MLNEEVVDGSLECVLGASGAADAADDMDDYGLGLGLKTLMPCLVRPCQIQVISEYMLRLSKTLRLT